MRLSPLLLVALVACAIAIPAQAEQSSGPDYRTAIRCATLNTVFVATEEDEGSDAAKEYEVQATLWLTHAILTGGKSEDSVDTDYNEALEALLAKLENEDTEEDFLLPYVEKCAEMEVEHADLFAGYAEE